MADPKPSVHTANTVVQALRHDLVRDEYFPGGLFYTELEAPSSLRRIDALWVANFSGHVTGYEIKVSKQDLLHELRHPEKCDPWKRFCDQWWLAVGDPNLIIGIENDIPEEWGICTPPTAKNRRKMTVLRPAPKLAPVDKAPLLGKLAGKTASDIGHATLKAERLEKSSNSLIEQVDAMRVELSKAGLSEDAHLQTELIRRALVIAKDLTTRSYRHIFDQWGLRYPETMELESQKVGRLIAEVFMADQLNQSVGEAAIRRVNEIQQVIADAAKPLSEEWDVKSVFAHLNKLRQEAHTQ